MMEIKGSELRAIRKFGGLTLTEMRDVVRVKTRKTLMNWEKGIGTPSINQFLLMLEACRINAQAYFELVHSKSAKGRITYETLVKLKESYKI